MRSDERVIRGDGVNLRVYTFGAPHPGGATTDQRTPAMAIGLTEHFLTIRVPLTNSYEVGNFDQPHLTRSLKQCVGYTPSQPIH
jgi:hypothetical protein